MTNEPNLGSGAYSQPGGGADVGSGDQGGAGAPTTNLNMQSDIPNQPGMGQMLDEGQTSHGDMMQPTGMGNFGTADPQMGGGPDIPGAGEGIETASSPSHSTDPNAPGHTFSEGLSMSSSMGTPDSVGGSGSSISDLPGTGTSMGATNIGGNPGTGYIHRRSWWRIRPGLGDSL